MTAFSHGIRFSVFSFLTASVVVFSLGGCALQTDSAAPAEVIMPAMQGRVMGGETPVAAAKITLWETDPSNSGYGITPTSTKGAKILAGPITSSSPGGNFTFATGYTCTAGNFVYITSTGGDVSNGSTPAITNNQLVLMAALGSCSNFGTASAQSLVRVDINELSTVAAAYALGSFMSVNENSGTPGAQQVYIGAPAANNAATGSCTGTGTAMTCTAAGLAHAFANAANLVDAVHYNGLAPSGLAFQTVPGNTLGSVPQAVINTLGNIVQFCTNSSGGAAGDNSNCGNLFTDATLTGGTAPADTLQALMNVAREPYNNVGSGTCTGSSGGLFCLAGSFVPFTPALTGAPHDWSLAITYSGATGGTIATANQSFGSPQYVALDANDTVYVQTADAYLPTQEGVAAMASDGTGLWSTAQSTTQCVPGALAPDTNGYIWESVSAAPNSTCPYAIYGYTAGSGALTYSFYAAAVEAGSTADPTHAIQSYPKPIAFDRFNNLWYGRNYSISTSDVSELPFTAGAAGAPGTYGSPTAVQNSILYANQILIDTNSNVFVANSPPNSATAGHLYLIYNTGTSSAPAYTATSGYAAVAMPSYNGGGLGLDSSGDVWSASNLDVSEFSPTVNGASSAFGSAITNVSVSASHPVIDENDGGGIFWYESLSSTGSIYQQITPQATALHSATGANNIHVVIPCYVPAGNNTCNSAAIAGLVSYAQTGDPKALQIDSTGAIWIAAGVSSAASSGFVVQILGAAYPTWPQYSYGVFGTEPQ